jgi:hypothetical protein
MPSPTIEVGTPTNLTASAVIGRGGDQQRILGFYVNSTSAGTILFAAASGGAAYSGTITPAIGFHRFPADCPAGLHVTIGGTLNVTVFHAG